MIKVGIGVQKQIVKQKRRKNRVGIAELAIVSLRTPTCKLSPLGVVLSIHGVFGGRVARATAPPHTSFG